MVSALQQRVVAGQHEDVVFGVEVVERARRERHAHRVAGAALHALLDELDRNLGDELLLQRLGDALGAVADDDHDALERQLRERVDDVQHHRAAAQLVQHLGCARPHARALPGGQHDGGERSVTAHLIYLSARSGRPGRAVVARGRGFEPRHRTPKDLVLPLHHPRPRHATQAAAARRADSIDYLNSFQKTAPTLRWRPDFVHGMPVAHDDAALGVRDAELTLPAPTAAVHQVNYACTARPRTGAAPGA